MKIGILTFHFACNYGALLQCYALQKQLAACGHQVVVVDYRPKAVAGGYRWFDPRRFWGATPVRFWRKTTAELKVIGARRRRYAAFDEFVRRHLDLSAPVSGPEDMSVMARDFDLLIVGSDQVWNRRITGGTDPVYWGAFGREAGTSLVSYAASMEDGFDMATEEAVRKYLPGFDALSVRERSLCRRLESCLPERKVRVVADPTLLMEPSSWDEVTGEVPVDVPYLLFYQVRKSVQALGIAEQMAARLGLKLICLSAKTELENSPEVISASPSCFLALFRHASFVVTTSFHGTVFSLMFRKEFLCVEVGDGKGSRQDDLLSAFGLQGRTVASLPDEKLPDIDWDVVEAARRNIIAGSFEYLKDCGV